MSGKILVTGANGFIGSHVVEELVSMGSDVIALNEYNSFGNLGWLKDISKEFEIISGDIRDTEFISKLVSRVEGIINLAALIAIPYSYSAGRSYLETNALGVLNILEAIKGSNKRLIHISTSEVYGTPNSVPIDEGHKIKPQSPYAASKAAADNLVVGYTNSFELNAMILRPFNTYGPRQSLRAIIPTVISQVLSNSDKIRVGSLEPKRDLTYVSDTASGMIAALNSSVVNEVIQLGTGVCFSVAELIEKIQSIAKTHKKIEIDSNRIRPKKSEVEILLSNPENANSKLGWKPKVNLDTGLGLTLNWLNNQNEYIHMSNQYNI